MFGIKTLERRNYRKMGRENFSPGSLLGIKDRQVDWTSVGGKTTLAKKTRKEVKDQSARPRTPPV